MQGGVARQGHEQQRYLQEAGLPQTDGVGGVTLLPLAVPPPVTVAPLTAPNGGGLFLTFTEAGIVVT